MIDYDKLNQLYELAKKYSILNKTNISINLNVDLNKNLSKLLIVFHDKNESEWKQQPGHTLWDINPKTTRVPGNPRKRIEEICCMTADIEYFRQWLTIEENLVLSMMMTLNKENLPDHLLKRSKIVIARLTRIINNTELTY